MIKSIYYFNLFLFFLVLFTLKEENYKEENRTEEHNVYNWISHKFCRCVRCTTRSNCSWFTNIDYTAVIIIVAFIGTVVIIVISVAVCIRVILIRNTITICICPILISVRNTIIIVILVYSIRSSITVCITIWTVRVIYIRDTIAIIIIFSITRIILRIIRGDAYEYIFKVSPF